MPFYKLQRSRIRAFYHFHAVGKLCFLRRLDITRIDDKHAFFRRQHHVPVGRIKTRKIAAQKILLNQERVRMGIFVDFS